MRLGLHAIGIGSGVRRGVIDAVARAADARGFATLWAGKHVVMVDRPASRHRYSADGTIAAPAAADWLDPLVALSFAAAATESITLATGVLLLPEHNPVLLATQAASLDVLCGGRLSLGIGVGWSREEFEALGIPFARRGARRRVSACDAHPVAGRCRLVRRRIRLVRGRAREPEAGARRADPDHRRRQQRHRDSARGDDRGWLVRLQPGGPDAVRDRLEGLAGACAEVGRDASELYIAVALEQPQPGDLGALEALGVDELVLVDAPPDTAEAAMPWLDGLAARWDDAAR
jgi:hypothetical protein